MTFCETWVIDNTVVTHLRNPISGTAWRAMGWIDDGSKGVFSSAILWIALVDSNQNRQVIYGPRGMVNEGERRWWVGWVVPEQQSPPLRRWYC